jgi:hypothetical protein
MAFSNILYILILVFLALPFLDLYPDPGSVWIYGSVLTGILLMLLRIFRGDD